MSELSELTPVEIDTALSKIWEKADRHFGRATGLAKTAERYERIGLAGPAERSRKASEEEAAKGREAAEDAVPYETEFTDRGGWHRYFLVLNSNGHIHRERNCLTCFPTTLYAWLVELADRDEAELVLKYGETACTVCFPNAPALKGWGEYKPREKAARAAERDKKAAAKRAETVPVPENNHTFNTEKAAEIGAVALFCWRELAVENRVKARAICAALGKKRGATGAFVEDTLAKRIKAKLKRDWR